MSVKPETQQIVFTLPANLGGDPERINRLEAKIDELRTLLTAAVGKLWWTERELAAELPNCSLLTLQRTRRAGKIKYKRIGNEILYSRKHIEDYLNSEK